MRKTILISGGNGRLCKELVRANNLYHHIVAPTREQMDVRNEKSIKAYIEAVEPHVFIHAAALTKPLSRHDEDIVSSIDSNIIGTCNVVKACSSFGVKIIYISTDYVYPKGSDGARETDPLLPFTNYGWSKLGGECAVAMYNNSLILRGAFFERPFPYPKAYSNIVKNQLYQNICAELILALLEERGVINIGSAQAQTIYEFALKTKPDVESIECTDSDVSPRMVLNVEKLLSLIRDQKLLDLVS